MSGVHLSGMQSSAEASDKGSVCEAGRERRLCLIFCTKGPDGCYMCGYADGRADGEQLGFLRAREELDRYIEEEFYGGLE